MLRDVINNWIGIWRLWWNLCPSCNFDAPGVDHCNVCHGIVSRAGYLTVTEKSLLLMRFRSEQAACRIIENSALLTDNDAKNMAEYMLAVHENRQEK